MTLIQSIGRKMMSLAERFNFNSNTARMVGALFLISNATFLLGSFALVEPILSDPEYLSLASANSNQIILGSLLEIANAFAYVGIAVLMFAVFRGRYTAMAIWYVAMRVIEFVMQTLSDLSPLKLVAVSEEFVNAGAPAAASFQAAGTLLLSEREWAFQMVSIALVGGALVLYTMMYRTNLIPRFISIWGFIAAILVLATVLLDIFGIELGSLEFLGLLMLLNELFLGLWLIIKGFNQDAELAAAA
jgi:hypothetical protein